MASKIIGQKYSNKKIFGAGTNSQTKYKNVRTHSKAYNCWFNMLKRCYDTDYQQNSEHITYNNCIVCDEWLEFQNFADWFYQNYKDNYQLDKDILSNKIPGKIYSKEYCCFIPQEINKVFTLHGNKRGNLKLGVTINNNPARKSKFYQAAISIFGKRKTIGYFETENEAYLAYIKEKENYIHLLAEKYKQTLNEKVYQKLLNYKFSDLCLY